MCYIKRIEVCLIHYPVIALAANIGLIVKLSKRGGDIDEVEQDHWIILSSLCVDQQPATLHPPLLLLLFNPTHPQLQHGFQQGNINLIIDHC